MLSIIIVHWKTYELLRACLSSILANPPTELYEVIVIDNSENTEEANLIREQFPEFQIIEPGATIGYAKGNNLGFSKAKGEWVLTLNPDTEFSDDSLTRATDVLSENPTYGILAGRLIDPNGKTQKSIRGFPTVSTIFSEFLGLARLFPQTKLAAYRQPNFDYNKTGPAPQPMGTFLLFRRQALEDIGMATSPFDESFPIFFNEVDLLYRLKQAGWPCLYSPEVQIKHYGGMSTGQVRPMMIWESHRSLVRYLRKHGSLGTRLALPLLTLIIYLVAMIRAKGCHAGFRA